MVALPAGFGVHERKDQLAEFGPNVNVIPTFLFSLILLFLYVNSRLLKFGMNSYTTCP